MIGLALAFGHAQEGMSWKPLAPVVAFDGTLFEELSPEVTGVHFDNRFDHPEQWTRLSTQYFLGTIGTGIALGDFNGDGLADIYAVGKDSPNALYLNRGDFRFEDVTKGAGVAGGDGFGAGASAVDIDNDGDLDLYVCYIGSPNELYVNNGAGVFEERGAAWGLDIDTGSNAPSFADYDRDGDLDLYLQCNFLQSSGIPDGLPDLLFENRGERFVEVTEQAGIEGIGQGHCALWWDFDEDGWPDVYVANDFRSTDKLYRNNRDGTFTDLAEEVLIAAPYSAMGGDVGDVNNDGHSDLLVAEMATSDIERFHRTVGSIGYKLIAAPKSGVSQYMKNMFSVKVGQRQFIETSYLSGLSATEWTWAARLVDLDNDGLLDAYFANGMARAFHDGDIGLKAQRASSARQRMAYFKASPRLEEQNLAYRNIGDLKFEDASTVWGLDKVGVNFAAAFADLDADGDLDLVSNGLESNLTLYRNKSSMGSRMTIRLVGESSNSYGIGARVTAFVGESKQMRELQLLRGYLSNDEPVLHFSFAGEDVIVDRLRIEWPSGETRVLENLRTGRHYRLSELAGVGESVRSSRGEGLFVRSSIELPDEAESREEYIKMFPENLLVPFLEDRRGPPLLVKDLDGDGWQDIVLGGPTGQELRVFRNVTGKSFEWIESDAFEDDFDSEDSDIAALDFDGDGDLDLVVTSGSYELNPGDEYYRNRVYLNEGSLGFRRLEPGDFGALRESSRRLLRADFGRNGELDLLIAGGPVLGHYPQTRSNSHCTLSAGVCRIVRDSFMEKLDRMEDLLVVDIDGDGAEDLFVARSWGRPRLLKNEGGVLRSRDDLIDKGELLNGVWSALARGDFNGDGRVDIAIGNIGTNTRFQANAQEPIVLFSPKSEVDKGKYILGKSVDGEFRMMDAIQMLRPQFLEHFDLKERSIAEYAAMTIGELFPPEVLERFDRFEINEVRSGVLFQGEDGRFSFQPLPNLAQSGAVRDLLVADVNGDGFDDIVSTHEYLPPDLWAERTHRGHIMVSLGDGRGRFRTATPMESGLEAHGDPRELAWADLNQDGRCELVVSMSDGPVLVFEVGK